MKSNSWIGLSSLIPISLLQILSHNHVTQCYALEQRENPFISLDSTIKSRCFNERFIISTSKAARQFFPDNTTNDESERLVTAIRGGATSSKDRDANQSNANLVARSRRQKLVVLLVTTALFNDMLQLTMLLPIIHTLITSPPPLGVASPLHNGNNNNAQVLLGIFFASKDICQMSFAPLAGLLTARTSSHLSLLLSLLGLALATLLFADATTFRRLLLARAAQGAASAAVLCGGMSLIAETHEGRLRGRAMGAAQTGLALGLLCGPLIGGLSFERLGRARTFRLAAGILGANALGMVGLMGWGSGEDMVSLHKSKESGSDGRKGVVTTTTTTNAKERSVRSLLENTKALLANRDILAVSLATLTIHAAVGVIKPISQVVLDEEFGVTMVNRSFIISIATVAYFLITPIAGYWCDDKYGTDDETSRIARRSNLVAWSLLLMFGSCGFFGLRYWMGIWAFYISVGLLGVALGLFKCSSSSLLADLVDRHKARKRSDSTVESEGEGEYSMVYALADVSDSLGLIVGPIAGLYLSQLYGPSVGVIAIGSLSLMLAPILMRTP